MAVSYRIQNSKFTNNPTARHHDRERLNINLSKLREAYKRCES
ncbi:predicted protein [Sclerotinia sclerotiorum 1980 UF-70]|uniref:Uncharacterized protein n=1 Tax=Sclerotinia sclerotiorum (strain ATCC 18683 / 1980 / Ss-1) TaxID=665079 RepID=A7F971_SCLS1|nr:predicted protein [Sclerotinia sclerotiorum 1980 UF-70]EDO00282.1 predicted protein [Sclerotinia sclerotiorum 1980 UF-70]